MGYIYKITNKINNKIYIGKTERTTEERWKEHCRQSKKYLNIPLYKAINKYGKENFIIETLEECNNEKIDEREIYWIDYYNAYFSDDYNCTGGGEGGIKPIPQEEIEIIASRYLKGERLDKLCKEFHHRYPKVREALVNYGVEIKTDAGPSTQRKKIIAINPKTNKIEYIFNSVKEASEKLYKPGTKPTNTAKNIGFAIGKTNIRYGYQWQLWNGEKEGADYSGG